MNEHLIYHDHDTAEYWKDVYKNKIRFASNNNSTVIPWEIETVDPNVPKLLDRFNLNSGELLEIGCGKGIDANYLSKRGFRVTAIDVSEDAIAVAKQNNRGLDIEFYSANFFDGVPTQKFDIVYDRGFLHNFKTRLSMIFEKVSFILNDQGKYIFITGNPNQLAIQSCLPPPVFFSEIEQTSSQWFKIISVEEIIFKVNENYQDSLGYIWYLEKR
jgi:2-polyprenyl-3-methyl-5-hydroxy-6-metoxy-1,4-benzoquinol methylase